MTNNHDDKVLCWTKQLPGTDAARLYVFQDDTATKGILGLSPFLPPAGLLVYQGYRSPVAVLGDTFITKYIYKHRTEKPTEFFS